MEKILHPEATRGTANYGWLQAKYSFSFANYFDPERTQFGMLRVLNDDIVAPGMGFNKHPHKNMEIVTIPQSGGVKHRDSLGNEGVVLTGDIQVMSAGSGVEHSELNASSQDPLRLFQIWVFPDTEEVTPRYDQKEIATLIIPNTFSTVVRPKSVAKKNELWIHQDAYFNIGEFNEDTTTSYQVNKAGHGVYMLVIEGKATVDGDQLGLRDAIGIWNTESISVSVAKNSRILLIEVPMN
jgi:redox-sensitive bicupin YhaK (pirin superfamily)